MPESPRDVLDSIFNSDTGYEEVDSVGLKQAPTYGEVLDFATLLTQSPSEEDVQVFVRDHPRFLTALKGWADDSVLAVIPKPPIGGHYFADFGVLVFGQGGCTIHLVELEPVDAQIFTKKLSPARRYQDAITQVQDWDQWIRPNIQTFVRDTVSRAMCLPQLPDKSDRGAFRTRPAEFIEKCWEGFSGFSDPRLSYTIILGRWAKLSAAERKRLIALNGTNTLYTTFTYDQMIRRGIERPFGHW